MKREITALTALSVCALLGCATRPPKLEFADGPGPHAFDCEAKPVYYEDFHIHPPGEKLKFTGLMQFLSMTEHPDAYWHSGVSIQFGTQSDKSPEPFAGLVGRVYPKSPNKMLFALRWGLKPSQETPPFAVASTDVPIPFELTLNESYQLTVSVGSVVKAISVPPFKVVRASLYCSGAHVRYSNVIVSAQ
jgi:hypothetical protein